MATHENLSVVLIQGTLVVGDSRHVLDDNAMVRVLTLLVEDAVRLDHVINDVGLGDLLGAELLLGAQVLAIVVAQVVVAGNGGQLDTSIDEEIDEGRLHLGLSGLEVVATNEGVVPLGELNGTRNKGVLGRAVDEGGLLKDTSHREDGRRRYLLVTLLNGLEKVVSSVIDTLDEVGISLGVGGPHDDDLVEPILSLEVTDILSNLLNVRHGGLGALKHVIGAILLVGSNEVRVVDGGKGNHLGHFLLDLGLESGLKDLSAVHGLGQVHLANVPTANDEVIGVDHGQDVLEWDVDLLVSLGIVTQLESRAHDDRTVVVGLARTLLGVPGDLAAVGEDTSGDGGAVVATPTDQHHTDLGDLAVDLEVVEGLVRGGNILAVGVRLNLGGTVGVAGLDLSVGVSDVGRVDSEDFPGGRGTVAVGVVCPVRGARAFRVRSHVD